MARIRTVKPEFFTSEDTGTLEPVDQLTYVGLWLQADREGRLKDRPGYLKTQIHPYRDMDMENSLKILTEHGLIMRYSCNGHDFIAIPTFREHQYPHVKEPASTIPAPDSPGAKTVPARVKHQSRPSVLRKGTVLRKGISTKTNSVGKSPPPPPKGGAVFSLPPLFLELWNLHPGPKGSKAAAVAMYRKIPPPVGAVVALRDQAAYKAACDKAGVFCAQLPHLERWIRKRRWEDEIPPLPKSPDKPRGCEHCGWDYGHSDSCPNAAPPS